MDITVASSMERKGRWTSSSILEVETKKYVVFYVIWALIFPCLLVWILVSFEGARLQVGAVILTTGIIVQVVLSILFCRTRRFYSRTLEGFLFLETRILFNDIPKTIEGELERLGIPFTNVPERTADEAVPGPLRRITHQYHLPSYDLEIIAMRHVYSRGELITRIFLGPISGTPDEDMKRVMMALEDGFL